MSNLNKEKNKLEKVISAEERACNKIERKSCECDKKESEINNKLNYQEAQKESKAEHKAQRKLEVENFEEQRLEREMKKHSK
ncbi:MAG: hypothetical protein ACRCYC_08070 [Paraclostridium sp.]|uniref:hypothetical protein n=1 Tax=Paraclostridium sp. TaxID=2023273 RepID=UPI00301F8718